jgi:hypothetical protein
MVSKHEEQEERLEILRNDQRLRNQGSTFSQFAASEAAEDRGRFTAHDTATVIGGTPTPAPVYPPAADWTRDPVPKEAQLGFSVNDLEVCGQPFEVKASIASLDPSSLPCSDQATPSAPKLSRALGAEGFYSGDSTAAPSNADAVSPRLMSK